MTDQLVVVSVVIPGTYTGYLENANDLADLFERINLNMVEATDLSIHTVPLNQRGI